MRLLLLLFATSSLPVFGARRCEPINLAKLDRFMNSRQGGNIVFFASWCEGCKSHLTATRPEKDVVIVTFDEGSAAATTLDRLAITTPCFTDEGIAKQYHVKSLPKVTPWRRKT